MSQLYLPCYIWQLCGKSDQCVDLTELPFFFPYFFFWHIRVFLSDHELTRLTCSVTVAGPYTGEVAEECEQGWGTEGPLLPTVACIFFRLSNVVQYLKFSLVCALSGSV